MKRLITVIPAIVISVIINVFICSIVSQSILINLISAGVERHLALAIALFIAIGTYSYIVFYNKIRIYIKNNGVKK